MKKILLLLIVCISLINTANAQHADRSKFIKDSLDVYISRALTNWRVPGIAVCIVKDNKVVLMKGYGIKELGLTNPVDINTLFMIGSNTKAFTATALAMLQSSGKLSLDEKVTKYIPEFKLVDKLAGEQAIVKDLLSHRLGFQTFEGDFTFYNTNLSRNDVIQRLGKLKPVYPFRTYFGYTNAAFLTAGEIIPRVAGKPWEAYLKENIFAPLGMINTLALSADMPKALNRSVPHTLTDGRLTAIPYCQVDALAPAGSISSSVNDMSKWVLALLNNGKVGARQVIPAAAIEATREPQTIVSSIRHLNDQYNYELYGLGWFIQDYFNHRLIMHTGGINGFVSSVTLSPYDNLGIIILTNTDQNELYESLRWDILDAFFGQPFRNYSDAYLKSYKADAAVEQAKEKKLRDSVLLNLRPMLAANKYTGKYINDFYGSMEVTQGENNDLEIRFEHHPKMFAKLQPLGGNRFFVTFSDPTLGKAVFPFTVQNGNVTSVRVKVADFVEMAPYDFKKQ
ncbi:CubicO group peptidase, beta-lactamase class C family [Mucilaginibacter pineti]|uniref:CubicO group peptidase, beta-lactamase class C family n=1 Tax=Mucilaginibacter pineti TaxID=1391627 RepID=A0A1G7DQG8_9SPHI|nr:serine hydrolase [Mucilaginibacter pineti]SDE53699.1 CubicO group peptidase, beta-lactamase class C family [Mucilaginibacter pineti]